VRCFIALPLPEVARRSLEGAAAAYLDSLSFVTPGESQLQPRISWAKTEGYHITLAFLGEIEGAAIDAAKASIEAAEGFGDFGFRIGGIGGFPSLGSWRVLFARLEDEGKSAELFRMVNEALVEAAGREGLPRLNPEWPGGKPFIPHVTLARAGSGRVKASARRAGAMPEPAGAWTLGRCALYKSELQRSGAVYTELRGVDLSGNSSLA
jgi:RNA 2',3'-cyclic 3'-phosphodiesterase